MSTSEDTQTTTEQLTIRLLDGADLAALRRLAERDSSPLPAFPLLGAELDGELIAAMPLDGGSGSIADPFRASADARALLERRARQLRGADSNSGGRFRRLFPRGRGTLGGSPPGAGGRLLRL